MMEVSSFGGCCSLDSGGMTIGFLHIIIPPLLNEYFGASYFGGQFWSVFYAIQACFSLMLMIGIVRKNADNVFPFVCMSFVTVVMLTYYVIGSLIRDYFLILHSQDEAGFMLIKITGLVVMCYFFMVVYAIYQQLLHGKLKTPLSTDNKLNCNGGLTDENILDDFKCHQTMEKNLDQKVIILSCEDLKKSII